MSTKAPYYLNPADLGRQFMSPKTIPAVTVDDFEPYHFVRNDSGHLSMRKGVVPKNVAIAGKAFEQGEITLSQYLDAIGVPPESPSR